LGVVVFLAGFIALPKVPVHITETHPALALALARNLGTITMDNWHQSPPGSLSEARAIAAQAATNMQDNVLLGGSIREEDSPGNYVVRQTTNGFEFVWFDRNGGDHTLDERR
jgi:hypothetical protein